MQFNAFMGFTDRDLVDQLRQNPYYQYFIGLEAFKHDAPKTFMFRKGKAHFKRGVLVATQICDATVAPQYIGFPQDTSLLNEARMKLENMIDFFCEAYDLDKPRTYRKVAHKDYLAFARSKKATKEAVRKAVKAQLSYVRRDLNYIDDFMHEGYAPAEKFIDNIIVIHILYEQQLYMYENNTHKVDNRIVSIHLPFVRPVMRGKAKAPTEFGAKLHLSVDVLGFGRIENLSFNSYNEGPMLIEALTAYKYRNGEYPERVLVDQIYRTEANIAFCNTNGIRISGPKLGHPTKDDAKLRKERKVAAVDNTDRIEVERYFSTAKRRNGMGVIKRKREDTSLSTIAMSILVTNIFGTFKLAVEEYENESSDSASNQKKCKS